MVRQENIETASTVTSIIPASTVNSDHNNTVIVTQNNQPEPIYYELINLDISNTLQKAKNLANSHRCDYGRSQSVTEGQGSVDDLQVNKLCHSEAYKTVLTSKRAYTATRSLSGNLQSQPEALQQCISAQRVPDPCRSVEKLHELLPDCEKIHGPSQHLQVAQWMASIDGKEEHDALNSRMEEKQPSTTKKSAKTAPVASSSNSNMKKQPQAQNKGKGKAPATKPYSQGYRNPKTQQDAMEDVFQMARTMMELQRRRKLD
ncbi:hypothetical protein O181_095328 [Austropuccinia psidii MF-1]|uniref:Uncharacterized protein n=1 Tax=Austropuccinia psidii MF-1 TaxID=1389203 RepID=A0A9Q3J4U5_9BASI|nr:hypothetical protein [Austropuccinia psidii MF-1]